MHSTTAYTSLSIQMLFDTSESVVTHVFEGVCVCEWAHVCVCMRVHL
jgi:hypothetical protein